MATAQTIIDGACRQLGFEPNASESADALEALNQMLETWALTGGVYVIARNSFTLSIGAYEYTIGPSATFNTTRPLRIVSAFIRHDGIDYPLDIAIAEQDYAGLRAKNLSGMPTAIVYLPGYPQGTIIFDRAADIAYGFHLYSKKPVVSFSALSDTVSLPPGYERAMKYNLAVDIADEFGKPLTSTLNGLAQQSFEALRRANVRPVPRIATDPGVNERRAYDITNDMV